MCQASSLVVSSGRSSVTSTTRLRTESGIRFQWRLEPRPWLARPSNQSFSYAAYQRWKLVRLTLISFSVRRTDSFESSTRRMMANFSDAVRIIRRPRSHPAPVISYQGIDGNRLKSRSRCGNTSASYSSRQRHPCSEGMPPASGLTHSAWFASKRLRACSGVTML